MSRYEDNELVRLYEEYWSACAARPKRWSRQSTYWLRYRQGTAAMIADRIARFHA